MVTDGLTLDADLGFCVINYSGGIMYLTTNYYAVTAGEQSGNYCLVGMYPVRLLPVG